MASLAIAGNCAYVERETATPGTYETIVEVFDIGDLPLSMSTYDVTYHKTDCLAARYRDIIPGMYDIVVFPIEANYTSGEFDKVFTASETADVEKYRLRYPDGYGFTFDAFVTNVTPKTALDDRLTFSFDLTVTGQVEYGTIT